MTNKINNTKYMILLLALVLLIPVGMSNTFAQEPGEEDFADVGSVGNTGAAYHELRIDAKKQDIKDTGDEMKALYDRIFELEATLADLNSEGITDEEENVKTTLDVLYAEADTLQEKAYEHFEIPEDRHQKLLDVKEGILYQYKDTTLLNDVFIDHLDESVQVILHSDYFESHKNSVLDVTDSITSDKFEDVTGEIIIGVKQFTASSAGASDRICAEFNSGHGQHDSQCAQATISFPATKGSVDGFVTVGHAFSAVLSSSADLPTSNLDVFQPGPNSLNSNNPGTGVFSPGNIDNRAWQLQIIGEITYGIYNSGTIHDSAFIDLGNGKTVDAEVTLWNNRQYPITSYESTSSQNVGAYVYQSGAATGYTSGHIISTGNDRGIYASYNECVGDSGAPVGQYSSGFKLFGMHVGKSRDIPGNADSQTASCAIGNGYSVYIPYDMIASDLDITGTT